MVFQLHICQEKKTHNNKFNLERHVTTKHESFSTKYPVGDAGKKQLRNSRGDRKGKPLSFNHWVQSSNNINMASFVICQETAQRGQP